VPSTPAVPRSTQVARRIASTSAGVSEGLRDQMSPQSPAVIGQAKLVPLTLAYEVVEVREVVRMLTPGANRSSSVP
jgi:hypothetical protein